MPAWQRMLNADLESTNYRKCLKCKNQQKARCMASKDKTVWYRVDKKLHRYARLTSCLLLTCSAYFLLFDSNYYIL